MIVLEFTGGPWDGASQPLEKEGGIDTGGRVYVPTQTCDRDGNQLFAVYVHESDNGIDVVKMRHDGFVSSNDFTPEMRRAARGE